MDISNIREFEVLKLGKEHVSRQQFVVFEKRHAVRVVQSRRWLYSPGALMSLFYTSQAYQAWILYTK